MSNFAQPELSIGAITVPAYTTNTEDDHLHILRNSGARGVIVSNRRLAERVLPAAHKAPKAEFVFAMDLPGLSQELSVKVLHMDDVLDWGRENHQNIVEMAGQWGTGDTACIIYTSGTTGIPTIIGTTLLGLSSSDAKEPTLMWGGARRAIWT